MARKPASTRRTPSRLRQSGFTPAAYGRAVREAAAERGLSGASAELFEQEAWAEMED